MITRSVLAAVRGSVASAVQNGLQGSYDSPYEPEAAALFARMDVEPSATRKGHINTLIAALKTAAVWDSLDVLYVLAAHDAQAARLNWKSSSYGSTVAGTITFEADRGYTGNGSTGYLDTGWDPATNGVQYTQNSASVWVWSRTSGQESVNCIGAGTSGTSGYGLAPRSGTDNMSGLINDGSAGSRTNTDGSGLFAIQRTSSSVKKYWRNGVQVGADISTASTGLNSVDARIGGATSAFSARQIAAAAFGASLAGKESAFYDALNAYMTALGAA